MAEEPDRVDPAESEEEDVYEVERIIDMRVEEGEVLYRVRWKNYCSDDDTWEPEAHLEDCREVLLAYKKVIAETKAKKEAEAKKKVLPPKSDLFDADSDSESDKERPTDLPLKKKKKKKKVEEPPPKEKKKKKKKKDRHLEDFRPLPAPETDEEEPPASPPTSSKNKEPDSDEDEEPVPTKKLKKEKSKEAAKPKSKPEEKKKRLKKEVKMDTSDDDTAPIEEDFSEGQSEALEEAEPVRTSTERIYLDDKFKEKKGKWEVKLQGFKDLIQKKESKKPDASPKETSLQKLKSLTSKAKEDTAPHSSDSSDSSTVHRKNKSKERGSSAAATAKSKDEKPKEDKTKDDKPKDDKSKEEPAGPKDSGGSTNLFEKFLLNCEAKDRAPRRPAVHQPPPEKSAAKPSKLIGKIEKIPKTSKESPVQRADAERTDKAKVTEAPASKPAQSHGFSLDSDEKEGDEFSPKTRPGDEGQQRPAWDRRERPDEAQRSSWDRHGPAGRRRDDSEPRLFMACDDSLESQDQPEHSDKTEKSTLNLGMDLNLDWMTLEDFQKHLNGDDEVLSGPHLSPSELRDAVRSGGYLAVKLALNSKEDHNLDQENGKVGLKKRPHSDTFEQKKIETNVRTRSRTRLANAAGSSAPLAKRQLRRSTSKNVTPMKRNSIINKRNKPERNRVPVQTRTRLRTRPQSDVKIQTPEEPLDGSDAVLAPDCPPPPKSDFLTGGCEDLVHAIHEDEVSGHILRDPVICSYGRALSAQHHHDKAHFPSIALKMRQLARLVMAARELDDSVHFLMDVFLPDKFEVAAEGAKRTFGVDPSTTLTKIGHSLKAAAEIARVMDCVSESDVDAFINLLETKWDGFFSQSGPESEELQAVDTSTVSADLLKLHQFLALEQEASRTELQRCPSLASWKRLSEATLADVCLFNRVRVGNIGRLLLETYKTSRSTGKAAPSADQIRKSTKLELDLGEQLSRLELEGQFGRSLLVLLTRRMVSLIELLVEHRDAVGVSQSNVYLFARVEGPSFVRGLDCLRRAAAECGVVHPEALFCPSLRAQIAGSWQLLSLCQSDVRRVSELSGRSVQDCGQICQNATVLEEVGKQLFQTSPSPTSTAFPKDGALPKCAVKRRPWSEQEQAAVRRFLSDFITKMKVPGKKECNACLAAEPDLCRRSWTDIKNYVHNTLQTLRRRQNQPEKVRPEKPAVPKKKKKLAAQRKLCEAENNNTPQPPLAHQSTLFPLDGPSAYAAFSADAVYANAACSFSSPSVLDAQVVPTYSQLGASDSALYSPDSRFLPPMSPSHPQHPPCVPLDYAPPDVDSGFTSLGCPAIAPTYATLSTAVFPPYAAAASDRNDYPPLDHYSTSPLTPVACSQVVPVEDGVEHPHAPVEPPGAVRRSVSDKRDSCSDRTWTEAKYFVHESVETLKQSGTKERTAIETSHSDWDPPVYLSL